MAYPEHALAIYIFSYSFHVFQNVEKIKYRVLECVSLKSRSTLSTHSFYQLSNFLSFIFTDFSQKCIRYKENLGAFTLYFRFLSFHFVCLTYALYVRTRRCRSNVYIFIS